MSRTDVGGSNRRPKAGPKRRQGLAEAFPHGNRMQGEVWASKKASSSAYLGAMTVHFPFQNTYAALPANFFARVAPTPVASPRLIKLNRPLAVQLGLDPDLLETPEGAEILAGKTTARRRRSDRDGLCRPPVRALCSPARRWPRHPARRGHRQGRRPPRYPAQGIAAPPRSPAAATAAPRSGRCCANTSSARRCSRWAFRPPARSPP